MRKTFIISLMVALLFSTSLSGLALVVPAAGAATKETAANNALNEWNSLSKKERNLRIKEAKKEIKNFKREKRKGKETDENTILLVILAILLPPLAVYLHQGEINTKFWISLVLTLLLWLPGVIYSLIVVLGAA
jgi:uncharacterized membrane protein YqaE (UPF0057 family)